MVARKATSRRPGGPEPVTPPEPVATLRLGDFLLTNDHCAIHTPSQTAIVADLHLGYEGAASQDGAYFPRVQKRAILQRFDRILKEYSPQTILINGDFKCTFDRNLDQEWSEIREVVEYLRKKVEVRLVRGNHDNFLANIIPPEWELPLVQRIPGLLATHGHKPHRTGGRTTVVLGHEHPSVMVRDEVGAAMKLQCYLYHPEKNVLVLPPLSTLATGYDVARDGFLSPILKPVPLAQFHVYALSEIGLMHLGRMGNLRESRRRG